MRLYIMVYGNSIYNRKAASETLVPLGQWIKWLRMVTGTSVLHAPQGSGLFFVRGDLCGYYNDLRNKVRLTAHLDKLGRPLSILASGEKAYFATTVAQYGLGAFDLHVETSSDQYLGKAVVCADWLVENQDDHGGWDVWNKLGASSPTKYSAMTQGEGASLLFRVARQTSIDNYYDAGERSVELMLRPLEQGGTSRTADSRLYLEEFVEDPRNTILNGWIFAMFGLYDGLLATERADFRTALEQTLESLAAELQNYDNGYWSLYDQLGRLASPFYHDLHIALLESCVSLFEIEQFGTTLKRWQTYRETPSFRRKAFLVKAWQKLQKREDIVITG